MKTRSQIEQAVRYLPRDQQQRLLDWLAREVADAIGVAESSASYGSAVKEREFFTLEEYFEMEENSSVLHEYVAGEIFAMADPSQAHDIIVMNISGPIHMHLQSRPCRVYTAHRQLRFKCYGDDIVYRPDVWVACGETRNAKGGYVDPPSIVIEVLSPSTARIDTREKMISYREIPSIDEYVVVAQKPAHVTIYRRTEQWQPRIVDSLDGVLELQSIGLAMAVRSIYKGVP